MAVFCGTFLKLVKFDIIKMTLLCAPTRPSTSCVPADNAVDGGLTTSQNVWFRLPVRDRLFFWLCVAAERAEEGGGKCMNNI